MKFFSITDIGRLRGTNQDYIFTSDQPVGNLPNLFIVADGMGGHRAGDFASKFTVDQTVLAVRESNEKEPALIMKEAIQRANSKLIQTARESVNMRGMGTTLVVAAFLGAHLYLANVGDSRLYVAGNDIRQITRDHSLVEEMIRMGEITRDEAGDHPDKHIITRAIGVKDDVEIDFFDLDLDKGELVLMCTDGLTNMVKDEAIGEVLRDPGSLAEKGEKLIETANSNGGKDNIAVIIIEPFADEVKGC